MDKEKQKKYLEQLIESTEREIVNMSVQLFLYEKEVKDPVHIGLEKAKENVGIYEKRIKYLNDNLAAYKLYAEENKL